MLLFAIISSVRFADESTKMSNFNFVLLFNIFIFPRRILCALCAYVSVYVVCVCYAALPHRKGVLPLGAPAATLARILFTCRRPGCGLGPYVNYPSASRLQLWPVSFFRLYICNYILPRRIIHPIVLFSVLQIFFGAIPRKIPTLL